MTTAMDSGDHDGSDGSSSADKEPGTAGADERSTVLKTHLAFAAIGMVLLGPLVYLFADRANVLFLIPAALFGAAWTYPSIRPAVVHGLLWAIVSFLLAVKGCGVPHYLQDADSRELSGFARLSDAALLAEIAETHAETHIRIIAIRNPHLTDQDLLARIATSDPDIDVRQAAISRLIDRTLLMEMMAEDSDSRVRRAAQLRLAELNQ